MGRPDFRSEYPPEWPEVSLRTKVAAGFRCVRCGHPGGVFIPEARDAEGAQLALRRRLGATTGRMDRVEGGVWIRSGRLPCDDQCRAHAPDDGKLRVLTVHHLDNDKSNLAWWNLILWEVEEWADRPIQAMPDRDPLLLRPIHGDLCAVVAAWDLTDLERAVMAGRREA